MCAGGKERGGYGSVGVDRFRPIVGIRFFSLVMPPTNKPFLAFLVKAEAHPFQRLERKQWNIPAGATL